MLYLLYTIFALYFVLYLCRNGVGELFSLVQHDKLLDKTGYSFFHWRSNCVTFLISFFSNLSAFSSIFLVFFVCSLDYNFSLISAVQTDTAYNKYRHQTQLLSYLKLGNRRGSRCGRKCSL